jgi:hypothetical protein
MVNSLFLQKNHRNTLFPVAAPAFTVAPGPALAPCIQPPLEWTVVV